MADFNVSTVYIATDTADFTMANGDITTREFDGKGWSEVVVASAGSVDIRGIDTPSFTQYECDAKTNSVFTAVKNGADGGHPILAAKLVEVGEDGFQFGDVEPDGDYDGSDGYWLVGAQGYRADPANGSYASASPELQPRAHAVLDYGEAYFNQSSLDYNALTNLPTIPDVSTFITASDVTTEVLVDGVSSTVDFSLDLFTGVLTITTT